MSLDRKAGSLLGEFTYTPATVAPEDNWWETTFARTFPDELDAKGEISRFGHEMTFRLLISADDYSIQDKEVAVRISEALNRIARLHLNGGLPLEQVMIFKRARGLDVAEVTFTNGNGTKVDVIVDFDGNELERRNWRP
jgi:hypothetical protein